jgi:ubiquinone/menaquinone biosynthesis C-methylase UbiE
MYRVVKPGGHILILDFSLDGIIRKIIYMIGKAVEHEGKINRFTKEQMKKMFTDANLKNIEQKYIYGNLVTMGEKING